MLVDIDYIEYRENRILDQEYQYIKVKMWSQMHTTVQHCTIFLIIFIVK